MYKIQGQSRYNSHIWDLVTFGTKQTGVINNNLAFYSDRFNAVLLPFFNISTLNSTVVPLALITHFFIYILTAFFVNGDDSFKFGGEIVKICFKNDFWMFSKF